MHHFLLISSCMRVGPHSRSLFCRSKFIAKVRSPLARNSYSALTAGLACFFSLASMTFFPRCFAARTSHGIFLPSRKHSCDPFSSFGASFVINNSDYVLLLHPSHNAKIMKWADCFSFSRESQKNREAKKNRLSAASIELIAHPFSSSSKNRPI